MAAQPQQRPQPSFHGLGDLEACGERRVVLNRPMLISGTGGRFMYQSSKPQPVRLPG
ncbi:unnamed protein product [Heterosigma akashiwo]